MAPRVVKKGTRKKRTPASWYNKKYSIKNLAVKAWNGVKAIRGIVNSEKKHFDSTQNGTTYDYNGAVNSLSAISQGDTIGTRNGNSILAKSLTLNYRCYSDASTDCNVRVMVFEDTMSLGTVPSASDVLGYTGNSMAPFSLLNMGYALQRRFKILYDKVSDLSGLKGPTQHGYQVYIPLGNTHIKWTNTTGTDEGRNQIYILIISSLVTTLLPNVAYQARLAYYDN